MAGIKSVGCITIPNEGNVLFGALNQLAPGHWAATLLPADDMFYVHGRRAAFLLGFEAQRFFEAATVKQLTKERRASQRPNAGCRG